MAEMEIVGLDDLIIKLEKISNVDLTQALNLSCILVENEAKTLCPVNTGALRASITHEVDKNEGLVGTNVEYAPYVEYGTGLFAAAGNGRQSPWMYEDAEGVWHNTSGSHPHPYLHPALVNNRQHIVDVFEEKISEVING